MNTKIGEIATRNPASHPLFRELGMDYCCGGNLTLAEHCLHKQLDPFAVIEKLEAAIPSEKLAELPDFASMTLTHLAGHIEETHHKYVREQIPEVLRLAAKVEQAHGGQHGFLSAVYRDFRAVSEELQMHMMKEERILFPYIKQLESGRAWQQPPFLTVANPLQMMEAEHEQAGQLMASMRTATGDYRLPDGACASFWQFYHLLEAFEEDLHLHIHLENNILFPKALALEEKLKTEQYVG